MDIKKIGITVLFCCVLVGCNSYPTTTPPTHVFFASDLHLWEHAQDKIPENFIGTWKTRHLEQDWYYIFREDGIFKGTTGRNTGMEGAYRIQGDHVYLHLQLENKRARIAKNIWKYRYQIINQQLLLTAIEDDPFKATETKHFSKMNDLPENSKAGWTQARLPLQK